MDMRCEEIGLLTVSLVHRVEHGLMKQNEAYEEMRAKVKELFSKAADNGNGPVQTQN